MSNIDIPTLEAYLFAENKQEFLNKLLPGTEAYSFFSILHKLNTCTSITPEIEQEVNRYRNNSSSSYVQNLHIRTLLKKFDQVSNDVEARNKVIQDLQNVYLSFSFNHTKPVNIVTSSLDKATKTHASTLNQRNVLAESQIELASKQIGSLHKIGNDALTKLDTKQIATANDVDVLSTFISKANPVDFDDFPKLLHELMNRRKLQRNFVYSYIENLTLKQLQELANLIPELNQDSTFIQVLCRKEFAVDSLEDFGKNRPAQEKRELLLRLKNWAQKQKVPVSGIITSSLYQILQLDLEMNRFDKQIFLEYLKYPTTYYVGMSQNFRTSLDNKRTSYHHELQSIRFGKEKVNQEELIREYLEHFFQTANSVSPFNEYFDSKMLDVLFYSTKLMAGTNLDSKEVLSPSILKELIQSKELKLCRFNQEYFRGTDPVKISLTIKNISSLMIKVFEFRPENFYLKEKQQLDASINLDGLIAAEETNVDFNEPPAKRFIKEFSFDSISKKKQGIFIIDFIGSGISSRCVIRKGKLSYLEEQSVAGQLFTIIDEETNICKGSHTGIWLKDRFYKTDDRGKVLVPFSSHQNEKAVIVHNDYAELVDIQLKPENLEFKCSYIYNTESFLMGNKAKILFQPRLFLNQQPIGLDIIQSCSAEIVTTSEDNVPSTISFDKLKLSTTEETELEFPVPAKLKMITIRVTSKIVPMGKKQPQDFSSSHSIPLNLNQSSFNFCDLFLRNTNTGYEVFVLGKNGEPKVGLIVNFTFTNRYLTQTITENLQTDSEGKITLGKLEEISNIEANLNPFGEIQAVYKSWRINNFKTINYPDTINVTEGDQITLPLLHNELNRHKFTFTETLSNQIVLHNCIQLLKIDNKKLIISGLKEGFYKLYLKDVKKTITITVYKGTYWSHNPNFLYTNDTLIDIKTDVNNIIITDFKVQPVENSDLADIIIGAYVDQPSLTRFHIFGTQFLSKDSNRNITDLDSNLPTQDQNDVFIGLRKSQYLNQRNLGDEYCYVLDRKSQARYLGNTLEKPKVLLKKTYVRDTTTKTESLAAAQDFIAAPPQEEEERKRRSMRRDGGVKGYKQKVYGSGRYVDDVGEDVSGFMVNPCLVYSNLKINEQGQIVLKNFPVKKYSAIQIVASNLSANISESFPLDSQKLQTKDLRQKPREENAVFSINRVGVHVPKGEKIQIKDMSSSKYQVIDSISKLFDVQKNLANFSSTFSAGNINYDQWGFLKEWESLKFEEKLRKYDKFASHELNLFVYFKDQEFFKAVVLPFIYNKIEKTFVDYFLLNDDKVILNSARVEIFKDLNSLEQILVIIALQKHDKEQAQRLVISLENRNSLYKVDINTFKRFFDIVLSSKNAEDEEQIQLEGVGGGGGFSQPPSQMPMQGTQFFGSAMPMQAMYSQNMMSNYAMPNMNLGTFSAAPQMQMQQQSYRSPAPQQQFGVQRRVQNMEAFASLNYNSNSNNAPENVFDMDFQDQYLEQRANIQAGFQELEKTKEYAERQYYERNETRTHININNFWVDLAKHIIKHGLEKPFLTQNFIYAHNNHPEMIAVLSFMSLPFKAGNHSYASFEGRGIEIQAASDSLIFTKAVTESQSELGNEVLIMQKFFDYQNRYTESEDEPGLQIEKEIDQYIIDKVYGCTVIITNLSASRQEIQALVEIPEGALPIGGLDYTKFHNLILESYATQTVVYYFYFPKTGKFKVNPPNVSKKGKVLAVGKTFDIEVKSEKTYTTLETLDAVLTTGSQEDVLNFARTKNIWNSKIFDFNAIYWLLSNKDFFLKFIQILREKKLFDITVWRYGFYHKDIPTIQEYFSIKDTNQVSQKLLYIDSSLMKVDKFKLLEYSPFMNQRVHLLASEKNRILNNQLEEQYKNYLSYLCEKNSLEAKHYLGLVYYLLLQDRIDEAIKFFGKIDREEIQSSKQYQLQYDYFCAYIDFVMGYPKFVVARDICQRYLDYPVLSWRSMFVDIANQLAEFDGEDIMEEEQEISEDVNKQNIANAQKEEVVSMEIQQNKLHITHQNVSQITLSFYRVDLEVLFSRNPFITQGKNEFSFIQPNERQQVDVVASKTLEKIVYEIPQRLQKYNLYIELRTENKTLYETYFSTSLQVHIIESYGQIKVLDLENKPLTKVYVKCFAKTKDGQTSFYKDGYTDLRGRFDYATLNSNDISNIKKFAIFVTSDELGSLIKEAKAPEKLGRVDSLVVAKTKKLVKKCV